MKQMWTQQDFFCLKFFTWVFSRAGMTWLSKTIVRVGTAAFRLCHSTREGTDTEPFSDASIACATHVSIWRKRTREEVIVSLGWEWNACMLSQKLKPLIFWSAKKSHWLHLHFLNNPDGSKDNSQHGYLLGFSPEHTFKPPKPGLWK